MVIIKNINVAEAFLEIARQMKRQQKDGSYSLCNGHTDFSLLLNDHSLLKRC